MSDIDKKVAIVTGSNTGVGFSLVEQLLDNDSQIEICMLCRNRTRAEKARSHLINEHPNSVINIIIVDVGNVHSVMRAAEDILTKYSHIDYCFMNAGIMPNTEVDWVNFLRKLFSRNFLETMVTANGILYQKNETNSEGLKTIFATNLFGHFLLVHQLISIMGGRYKTQIVWTSSSNASKKAFHLDDIQHEKGREAYSSSKHAIDLLSYHLNSLFNHLNIYSHTTCPGLVMSNLTYSIIPRWSWWLIIPILIFIRCILPSMTLSAENGAHVLYWLTQQDVTKLPWDVKFYSRTSFFGKKYVQIMKNDIERKDAENLYSQLSALQIQFSSTFN